MNLSAYAAPIATIAVAVIAGLAGRFSGTRKSRELEHLKSLFEVAKTADEKSGSAEAKILRAQLIYEVEFYAARNSGRDKWTHGANWAFVVLGVVTTLFFSYLTLTTLNDDPIDYGLSAALGAPAIVSFIVTAVYAGRVDRIAKEREARTKRDAAVLKIEQAENRAKKRAEMIRWGTPTNLVDMVFPPD